eukprot:scaffold270_cov121-Isochrysis_galbana.AAC.19
MLRVCVSEIGGWGGPYGDMCGHHRGRGECGAGCRSGSGVACSGSADDPRLMGRLALSLRVTVRARASLAASYTDAVDDCAPNRSQHRACVWCASLTG